MLGLQMKRADEKIKNAEVCKMGVLAEALSLKLTEKGLANSIEGDKKEGVIIQQRLEKSKIVTTVLFLTDDETKSVSIRFYNFYKMEHKDITDELFVKLNEFNKQFRWAKVMLDDDDIVIGMESLVTPFNVGDICIELTYYGASIADLVYSQLEAMKYNL